MTVHRIGGRGTVDELDRRIIALLEEDARRSYGSIGRQVFLSASAVKRRIDGLRASRALLGFTAVIEDEDTDEGIEAFVSIWLKPGFDREQVVESLGRHPEVGRAWMVSGEVDAVAHVRADDIGHLDDLVDGLKRDGFVDRVILETVKTVTARGIERKEGAAV